MSAFRQVICIALLTGTFLVLATGAQSAADGGPPRQRRTSSNLGRTAAPPLPPEIARLSDDDLLPIAIPRGSVEVTSLPPQTQSVSQPSYALPAPGTRPPAAPLAAPINLPPNPWSSTYVATFSRGKRARWISHYYTRINDSRKKGHCRRGEGNQIVIPDNRLIGSNCKVVTDVNCRYGIGTGNRCMIPCVHGAGGGAFRIGEIVTLPRKVRCPDGPFKGQDIERVVIADRGLLDHGQVDVFEGFCRKSHRGVCTEIFKGELPGRSPWYDSDPNLMKYSKLLGLGTPATAYTTRPKTASRGLTSR